MNIGRQVLRVLVALIAVIMAFNALAWIFAPSQAAEALGMPLLTGKALSSQMDIGAFFLAATIFTVAGLLRSEGPWLIAAAVLLLSAAIYRTVAFLFHGAAFPVDMVALEFAMGTILIIASRVYAKHVVKA